MALLFRSRRSWYDIRFNARSRPTTPVVAFEFQQVGGPVPRKDWEEL